MSADFSKELEVRTSKLNKIILYLTFSDVFTWGPYMIITTLSGIYLANKLGENVIEFIGLGVSIYFITRAVLQLPIGIITDKIKRDRDEIILLISGTFLMGVPFLLYPMIKAPAEYFFLQFIFGVGTALNLVNWRKLFAKNLDKDKEGFEYAMYEMIMSFSTAGLTAIAGTVANIGDAYFDFVMIGSGVLMMLASFWGIAIYFTKHRKSSAISN
jgi:MFS family permease